MKRTQIKTLNEKFAEFGGKQVKVCGWARTIRDSKNIAFIELNDGAFKGCQIVVESGKISNASGKIVFETMLAEDKEVSEIIKEKNLSQNSNTDELEALARDVLSQNEKSVTDYKGGKTNALGFLVGQCMKASKGQANPGMMRDIVIKLLSE